MNNNLKKLAKFYKKASKMKEPVIEYQRWRDDWDVADDGVLPGINDDLNCWRVTEGYKESEGLPCPFCGGRPEYSGDDYGNSWFQCCECGARTGAQREGHEKELYDTWNTRQNPEGYVPVPLEPTEEMLKEGGMINDQFPDYEGSFDFNRRIYKAMIKAVQESGND